MPSLYKINKHIFIVLMTITLSSCSVISEELSCKFSEIDCYRFDYSSMDQFKYSVTEYAEKWSLKDPSIALSKLTANKNLSIKSAEDSETLITAYPEDIFILGRYISENHKPREWLFIGEQAFLRSWNNLNR
ncbi:MAG: hypothetical protein MK386_03350 [Candidatus Thioglobus autotrophicus]|nr:hypothetical protein [Candidatus Thioglobus autotrophicus]